MFLIERNKNSLFRDSEKYLKNNLNIHAILKYVIVSELYK